MKIKESFILITLIGIFLFFEYITMGYISTGEKTEAWIFPQVLIRFSLVFLIGIAIKDKKILFKDIKFDNPIRIGLICISSICCFVLWQKAHFIIAMFLFLLSLGYIMKLLSKQYVVSIGISTIAIYFFFVKIFNVLL